MTACSPRIFPISASQLVPHGSPMLLVESLEQADGEGGIVRALVERDSLFACPEAIVEPMILLEIIAQACAVHGGWLAKNAGQSVRDAFLAGVRSFEILGKVVAGKAMEIEVALVKEFGGFHLYQGVVRQDKCEMARATLKAYHPVVSPLGA